MASDRVRAMRVWDAGPGKGRPSEHVSPEKIRTPVTGRGEPLEDLRRRYVAGVISRREFIGQGLALGLSLGALGALLGRGPAPAAAAGGDIAQMAVAGAQRYKGQSVTLTYEASLQAQGPLTMIPKWEQATGTKVNLSQLPYGDLYSKPVAAHLAGSSEYDVLCVSPSWIPDLVNSGVIEPSIDAWLSKYGVPAQQDAADYPPFYWKLQQYLGKRVGFLTDGDVFVLYYRSDWFADPATRTAFKAQHGYDLAAPKTWKQYDDILKFFTERGQGKTYGAGLQRTAGQVYEWFLQHFGAYGGKYFDPQTMKPGINGDAGVRAMADMVQQNKFMPPGVEKWDFLAAMTAFMTGQTAMLITWPPVGKWANGYGLGQKLLSWVPPTKISGKVGYAIPPGGHPQFASGLMLTISSDSRNKDLAYLFAQWYTSPSVELDWIPLTYALGKPTRNSQYVDPKLQTIFPTSNKWLENLKSGAYAPPHPDVNIPGSKEYHDAVDEACTAAFAGTDPKAALDQAAAKWSAVTQRLGVDKQRQAYVSFLRPLEDASVGHE